MILRTNKDNCYFIDNDTKSDKFIDSPELKLYYDGKIINVNFDTRTNVITGKDENGTTYVVDDGYRNTLIRAGYIVYRNYDEIQADKSDGPQIKDQLISIIFNAIKKSYPEINVSDLFDNGYYFEKEGYRFNILLRNNIDIVNKNQERKINGLQFYPFDKRMDNYGTLYIMVYCQRISDQEPQIKSNILVDNILANVIANSNDLKFVAMNLGNPIYYTRGK